MRANKGDHLSGFRREQFDKMYEQELIAEQSAKQRNSEILRELAQINSEMKEFEVEEVLKREVPLDLAKMEFMRISKAKRIPEQLAAYNEAKLRRLQEMREPPRVTDSDQSIVTAPVMKQRLLQPKINTRYQNIATPTNEQSPLTPFSSAVPVSQTPKLVRNNTPTTLALTSIKRNEATDAFTKEAPLQLSPATSDSEDDLEDQVQIVELHPKKNEAQKPSIQLPLEQEESPRVNITTPTQSKPVKEVEVVKPPVVVQKKPVEVTEVTKPVVTKEVNRGSMIKETTTTTKQQPQEKNEPVETVEPVVSKKVTSNQEQSKPVEIEPKEKTPDKKIEPEKPKKQSPPPTKTETTPVPPKQDPVTTDTPPKPSEPSPATDKQEPKDVKSSGKGGWGLKKFINKFTKQADKPEEAPKEVIEESSDSESYYSNAKHNQQLSSHIKKIPAGTLVDSFKNLSATIESEFAQMTEEKKKSSIKFRMQQMEGDQTNDVFPYEAKKQVKPDDRVKLIKHFSTNTSSKEDIETKCISLLDMIKFFPKDLVSKEFRSDFLNDISATTRFDPAEVIEEYFEKDQDISNMWNMIISHTKKIAGIDPAKKPVIATCFARTIYTSRFGKPSEKEEIIKELTEFLKGCLKTVGPPARKASPTLSVLADRPSSATSKSTDGATPQQSRRFTAGPTRSKRTTLFMNTNNPFTQPAIKPRFADSSDSEDGGSILASNLRKSTPATTQADSDSDFD